MVSSLTLPKDSESETTISPRPGWAPRVGSKQETNLAWDHGPLAGMSTKKKDPYVGLRGQAPGEEQA